MYDESFGISKLLTVGCKFKKSDIHLGSNVVIPFIILIKTHFCFYK